jgi:hypothetical protein
MSAGGGKGSTGEAAVPQPTGIESSSPKMGKNANVLRLLAKAEELATPKPTSRELVTPRGIKEQLETTEILHNDLLEHENRREGPSMLRNELNEAEDKLDAIQTSYTENQHSLVELRAELEEFSARLNFASEEVNVCRLRIPVLEIEVERLQEEQERKATEIAEATALVRQKMQLIQESDENLRYILSAGLAAASDSRFKQTAEKLAPEHVVSLNIDRWAVEGAIVSDEELRQMSGSTTPGQKRVQGASSGRHLAPLDPKKLNSLAPYPGQTKADWYWTILFKAIRRGELPMLAERMESQHPFLATPPVRAHELRNKLPARSPLSGNLSTPFSSSISPERLLFNYQVNVADLEANVRYLKKQLQFRQRRFLEGERELGAMRDRYDHLRVELQALRSVLTVLTNGDTAEDLKADIRFYQKERYELYSKLYRSRNPPMPPVKRIYLDENGKEREDTGNGALEEMKAKLLAEQEKSNQQPEGRGFQLRLVEHQRKQMSDLRYQMDRAHLYIDRLHRKLELTEGYGLATQDSLVNGRCSQEEEINRIVTEAQKVQERLVVKSAQERQRYSEERKELIDQLERAEMEVSRKENGFIGMKLELEDAKKDKDKLREEMQTLQRQYEIASLGFQNEDLAEFEKTVDTIFASKPEIFVSEEQDSTICRIAAEAQRPVTSLIETIYETQWQTVVSLTIALKGIFTDNVRKSSSAITALVIVQDKLNMLLSGCKRSCRKAAGCASEIIRAVRGEGEDWSGEPQHKSVQTVVTGKDEEAEKAKQELVTFKKHAQTDLTLIGRKFVAKSMQTDKQSAGTSDVGVVTDLSGAEAVSGDKNVKRREEALKGQMELAKQQLKAAEAHAKATKLEFKRQLEARHELECCFMEAEDIRSLAYYQWTRAEAFLHRSLKDESVETENLCRDIQTQTTLQKALSKRQSRSSISTSPSNEDLADSDRNSGCSTPTWTSTNTSPQSRSLSIGGSGGASRILASKKQRVDEDSRDGVDPAVPEKHRSFRTKKASDAPETTPARKSVNRDRDDGEPPVKGKPNPPKGAKRTLSNGGVHSADQDDDLEFENPVNTENRSVEERGGGPVRGKSERRSLTSENTEEVSRRSTSSKIGEKKGSASGASPTTVSHGESSSANVRMHSNDPFDSHQVNHDPFRACRSIAVQTFSPVQVSVQTDTTPEGRQLVGLQGRAVNLLNDDSMTSLGLSLGGKGSINPLQSGSGMIEVGTGEGHPSSQLAPFENSQSRSGSATLRFTQEPSSNPQNLGSPKHNVESLTRTFSTGLTGSTILAASTRGASTLAAQTNAEVQCKVAVVEAGVGSGTALRILKHSSTITVPIQTEDQASSPIKFHGSDGKGFEDIPSESRESNPSQSRRQPVVSAIDDTTTPRNPLPQLTSINAEEELAVALPSQVVLSRNPSELGSTSENCTPTHLIARSGGLRRAKSAVRSVTGSASGPSSKGKEKSGARARDTADLPLNTSQESGFSAAEALDVSSGASSPKANNLDPTSVFSSTSRVAPTLSNAAKRAARAKEAELSAASLQMQDDLNAKSSEVSRLSEELHEALGRLSEYRERVERKEAEIYELRAMNEALGRKSGELDADQQNPEGSTPTASLNWSTSASFRLQAAGEQKRFTDLEDEIRTLKAECARLRSQVSQLTTQLSTYPSFYPGILQGRGGGAIDDPELLILRPNQSSKELGGLAEQVLFATKLKVDLQQSREHALKLKQELAQTKQNLEFKTKEVQFAKGVGERKCANLQSVINDMLKEKDNLRKELEQVRLQVLAESRLTEQETQLGKETQRAENVKVSKNLATERKKIQELQEKHSGLQRQTQKLQEQQQVELKLKEEAEKIRVAVLNALQAKEQFCQSRILRVHSLVMELGMALKATLLLPLVLTEPQDIATAKHFFEDGSFHGYDAEKLKFINAIVLDVAASDCVLMRKLLEALKEWDVKKGAKTRKLFGLGLMVTGDSDDEADEQTDAASKRRRRKTDFSIVSLGVQDPMKFRLQTPARSERVRLWSPTSDVFTPPLSHKVEFLQPVTPHVSGLTTPNEPGLNLNHAQAISLVSPMSPVRRSPTRHQVAAEMKRIQEGQKETTPFLEFLKVKGGEHHELPLANHGLHTDEIVKALEQMPARPATTIPVLRCPSPDFTVDGHKPLPEKRSVRTVTDSLPRRVGSSSGPLVGRHRKILFERANRPRINLSELPSLGAAAPSTTTPGNHHPSKSIGRESHRVAQDEEVG